MLTLKDAGVLVAGLRPELYFALGVADQAFAEEGLECVITAGTNGDHNPNSKHPKGEAVDIRNAQCSSLQHDRILVKLTRLEKYGFDLVDEKPGATLMTTGRHFHIELDIKPGETFWHVGS